MLLGCLSRFFRQAAIRRYLEMECRKLISRHESMIRRNKRDQGHFEKRTGRSAGRPSSYRPQYWELHPHFDPYYVRARLDEISHGLAESVRSDKYRLMPACSFQMP